LGDMTTPSSHGSQPSESHDGLNACGAHDENRSTSQ
jgi:hypothetical protein